MAWETELAPPAPPPPPSGGIDPTSDGVAEYPVSDFQAAGVYYDDAGAPDPDPASLPTLLTGDPLFDTIKES